MQEATFLILTALADGSQHGYGIIATEAKFSSWLVVEDQAVGKGGADRPEVLPGSGDADQLAGGLAVGAGGDGPGVAVP